MVSSRDEGAAMIAPRERTGKAPAPQSGDVTCATGAGDVGELARGMAARQGRDTQGLDVQRNSPAQRDALDDESAGRPRKKTAGKKPCCFRSAA